MKDYIFYAQLIVLILNVVVFIYIMSASGVYMRFARVILLVAIFVGTLANFGKLTMLNVLFAFTPFLTLINIRQHGKNHRTNRSDSGGSKQHLQNLQGNSKALLGQKA